MATSMTRQLIRPRQLNWRSFAVGHRRETRAINNTLPALVFDLDGTLVETAPDLLTSANVMLEHAKRPPITSDQIKNMIGDGMLTLATRAFEATGGTEGIDLEQANAGFIVDYNQRCCVDSYLYDGVRDVLEELRDAGHIMAVCTNKPEAPANTILQGLEIEHYFQAVVGGDTLPVKKPDAGHLIATIEMAGADPNLAIMIGDGHNDAKVARAAGVPALMLSYGYTRIPLVDLKPAAIIDHFGEIPEALQRLMDAPSY
jgi:phosphoglycolate phosphatase